MLCIPYGRLVKFWTGDLPFSEAQGPAWTDGGPLFIRGREVFWARMGLAEAMVNVVK